MGCLVDSTLVLPKSMRVARDFLGERLLYIKGRRPIVSWPAGAEDAFMVLFRRFCLPRQSVLSAFTVKTDRRMEGYAPYYNLWRLLVNQGLHPLEALTFTVTPTWPSPNMVLRQCEQSIVKPHPEKLPAFTLLSFGGKKLWLVLLVS